MLDNLVAAVLATAVAAVSGTDVAPQPGPHHPQNETTHGPANDVGQYKRMRKAITAKWGLVTVGAGFAFIMAVGLLNLCSPTLLKWLSHRRQLRRLSKKPVPWYGLAVGLWAVGVAYALAIETRSDITYVVKRMGRVAVAMMPPIYFMTLKPSPLPNTVYLTLLPLHKWISRLLVLVALAHGVLYVYIYTQTGKLRKLTTIPNLCGIAALLSFIGIAVTSLAPVRRRAYGLFYAVHYSLAWIVLGLLYMHSVPPSVGYQLSCAAILAYQALYRIYTTVHTRLQVQYVSPTLYYVTVPREKVFRVFGECFLGSHVRVGGPLWNPRSWFESSHPYTIASLPEDRNLVLVIRKSRFPIRLRQTYALTGPYRTLPDQFMLAARSGHVKRALMVIGGSGIAFGAPVMRYLQQRGVRVKMLWAIREPQDAKVLRMLGLHEACLTREVEVYYTREHRRRRSLHNLKALEAQIHVSEGRMNEDEGLELITDENCCMDGGRDATDRTPLLSSPSQGPYQSYDGTTVMPDIRDTYHASMFNNRPRLDLRVKSWLCGLSTDEDTCCCVDRLIQVNDDDKRGAWVIASGVSGLVSEARRWANNNGFSFYQEDFTL